MVFPCICCKDKVLERLSWKSISDEFWDAICLILVYLELISFGTAK